MIVEHRTNSEGILTSPRSRCLLVANDLRLYVVRGSSNLGAKISKKELRAFCGHENAHVVMYRTYHQRQQSQWFYFAKVYLI